MKHCRRTFGLTHHKDGITNTAFGMGDTSIIVANYTEPGSSKNLFAKGKNRLCVWN